MLKNKHFPLSGSEPVSNEQETIHILPSHNSFKPMQLGTMFKVKANVFFAFPTSKINGAIHLVGIESRIEFLVNPHALKYIKKIFKQFFFEYSFSISVHTLKNTTILQAIKCTNIAPLFFCNKSRSYSFVCSPFFTFLLNLEYFISIKMYTSSILSLSSHVLSTRLCIKNTK